MSEKFDIDRLKANKYIVGCDPYRDTPKPKVGSFIWKDDGTVVFVEERKEV